MGFKALRVGPEGSRMIKLTEVVLCAETAEMLKDLLNVLDVIALKPRGPGLLFQHGFAFCTSSSTETLITRIGLPTLGA